jgi:DNA-binding NtrC family response regulator
MVSSPKILFVDDDADVQKAAAMLLPRRGFELHAARSPEEAWSVLAAHQVDAILLDLNFHRGATTGEEGLRMLRELITYDPEASVVVVTGHSGIAVAVAAMRAGATDFVMKPWNNDRLVATLSEAIKLRRERRSARPNEESASELSAETLKPIGVSPAMQRAFDIAHRAAATAVPVLLLGEAGTGKSLFAQMIHRQSPRSSTPFTAIDLTSLVSTGEAAPEAVLDGADPAGTVFLDEVGSLPLGLQGRLIAALAHQPGFRLIAATRKTRLQLQDGSVQADLLYRLNTVEIFLPPLRDRGDDRLLLADHFVRLFAARYGRAAMTLSESARTLITDAPWPGNVRELRQAMERAVVLAQSNVLQAADMQIAGPAEEVSGGVVAGGDMTLAMSEKAIVAAALRRHGFNVSHAAKELGITRAALYRRMARHGL